jgi:hypothetical protein
MAISNASQPVFNAANFKKGQEIDNKNLPYKPGTTFVYDTFTSDNQLEQIDTVKVTHQTKRIDGVKCTVVLDVVRDAETGEIIEKTHDYFAQDKSGNVWYFGEATKEFENGKPVGTEGSWKAGVNGAVPGIIMEAKPKVGDSYDQENAPGIAQDHAEVLSLTGSATVPFGTFNNNLLVTHEDTVIEPDASETKSYAAGIGQVFGVDLVTGEQDRLVSVTTKCDAKLVQAMASFGANGPALDSTMIAGPNNEAGQLAMLAGHGHHG